MIDLKYKDGDTWVSVFYPVGSLYFSTVNTSPASTVGGAWTKIENAVIRSLSSGSIGYTGSDTHKLTTNEMPAHQHKVRWKNYGTGGTGDTGWDEVSGNQAWRGSTYDWHGRGGNNDGYYAASVGGGSALYRAKVFQLLCLVSNSLKFFKVVSNNGYHII